jgi:hypothetical protein
VRTFAIAPTAQLSSLLWIALIGAAGSGKTCYSAALNHTITKQLSGDASYQMSLEFGDTESLLYQQRLKRLIFREQTVPAGTPRQGMPDAPPLGSWTLRLPVRSRFRQREVAQRTVSLLLPDAAGEHFETMNDPFFVTLVSAADAIILLVDPLASPEYQELCRKKGRTLPAYVASAIPADEPLNHLARALRRKLRVHEGKLPRQLAVVVTKCDSFADPLASPLPLPVQGRRYDTRLAQTISDRVREYLKVTLNWPDLVALAERSFEKLAFFAVSALGQTPQADGKLLQPPKPRRVEEPLLWILHQWGYL